MRVIFNYTDGQKKAVKQKQICIIETWHHKQEK